MQRCALIRASRPSSLLDFNNKAVRFEQVLVSASHDSLVRLWDLSFLAEDDDDDEEGEEDELADEQGSDPADADLLQRPLASKRVNDVVDHGRGNHRASGGKQEATDSDGDTGSEGSSGLGSSDEEASSSDDDISDSSGSSESNSDDEDDAAPSRRQMEGKPGGVRGTHTEGSKPLGKAGRGTDDALRKQPAAKPTAAAGPPPRKQPSLKALQGHVAKKPLEKGSDSEDDDDSDASDSDSDAGPSRKKQKREKTKWTKAEAKIKQAAKGNFFADLL